MDPIKLDEHRKKRRAELMSQLNELKAELKKLRAERSLAGAKVTDDDPNKLSEMEKLRPLLAEMAQKQKAALQEAYKKREPLCLRLNYAAASPPAFSEDGEGKEA